MRYAIIVLLAICMTGCAAWQTQVQNMATTDKLNAATTRIAAREIASTWSLNSGALSVVLVKFKGLLPCDCDGDIKILDDIAAKCIIKDSDGNLTCVELTDKDAGITVITWAWVWGTIAKSGVQQVMTQFFPALMGKILPYVTAIGL